MKNYEYELARQKKSFYSAIEKRLNLQTIGAFLRTGNGDIDVYFNNFREREQNAFSVLERKIVELCGKDNMEKIFDVIMDYKMITDEIQFSLGMKAGATLLCKLTDNFETDV